ncbi:MAG: HD domain-containing protein [Pseudomonadota bacterium]
MYDEYVKLFEIARPFLDTRDNENHTRIAYEFAVRLLDEEGGDPDVILPAVILHDVGWKCVPEDLQLTAFGPGKIDAALNRIHETEGARIARELLEKVDYPAPLIDEIAQIVEGHDSVKQPHSLNDAVVKDADKLCRYTEIGFDTDSGRFGIEASDYLAILSGLLDEWFHTPTAKRIAREEYGRRVRRQEGQ